MNDATCGLDQAEEEALSYDVSDEAVEAAAGLGRAECAVSHWTCRITNPGCV
jgi:hypothetical protein